MPFRLQVVEEGKCVAEHLVTEGQFVRAEYRVYGVSVFEGGDHKRGAIAKIQGFRGGEISDLRGPNGKEIASVCGRMLLQGEVVEFTQVPQAIVTVENVGMRSDGVIHFQHRFEKAGALKILG